MTGREPGTQTEDLATFPVVSPGRLTPEQRLRRWGNRNYAAGIILGAGNIITSFVVAMLTEDKAFVDPDAKLIATVTHISINSLALALVLVGAIQQITAHTRTHIDRNRRRLDQVADEVEQVRTELRGLLAELGPIMRAVPDRLSATIIALEDLNESVSKRLDVIEKAMAEIPDFGKVFEAGFQLRKGPFDLDNL
jgi:hypothetical protein